MLIWDIKLLRTGGAPNLCGASHRQSRRFGAAGKGPLRGGLNSEQPRAVPGGACVWYSRPATPPPGIRDREARPPPALDGPCSEQPRPSARERSRPPAKRTNGSHREGAGRPAAPGPMLRRRLAG
jgi:hypothetical protein